MSQDPRGVGCEWCGEPSVEAVEREKKVKSGFVKTGMFIYACRDHLHLAEADRIIRKR
jgi:hypothetical protein